ncbi:hypothetical protein J6590_017193 [Homalodisca vitripennis]|nr:hypothetical protein J6590_017193 [Homalodisca vitripennis]
MNTAQWMWKDLASDLIDKNAPKNVLRKVRASPAILVNARVRSGKLGYSMATMSDPRMRSVKCSSRRSAS